MESISIFEMIKVGIGPSSSHTMGPWVASEMFIEEVEKEIGLENIRRIEVHLFGSLAKTGRGHGTHLALLMGLSGENFKQIDTHSIHSKSSKIKENKQVFLKGLYPVEFDPEKDIIFNFKKTLPYHSNGMTFIALAHSKTFKKNYYSLGGGFVASEQGNTIEKNLIKTPYPCHNAKDIQSNCSHLKITVSDLIYLNEQAWRSKAEIRKKALEIWEEMKDSIFRGIHHQGVLPGGLEVKRRAGELSQKLLNNKVFSSASDLINYLKNEPTDFTKVNKWISCFALAVNEENASFGRIVTAPTNGAAGVVPAVLMYAYCFIENFDEEKVIRFILTAGEIATLFKKNATISAAMGGCQAEIGVSSSMAAAALTECLGGTPEQVLMAAEIAMEHHLGLTCDPVGGLVQIPCIERNTMGAIKAITATNIAMESDPQAAKVSLDKVIESMWNTARNMSSKFKETSEGGLAVTIPVNISEC